MESKKYTRKDLQILQSSINIPSLTDRVVDEDYSIELESELEKLGFSINWVSLDDFGFISISFRSWITDEMIGSVLKSINKHGRP